VVFVEFGVIAIAGLWNLAVVGACDVAVMASMKGCINVG